MVMLTDEINKPSRIFIHRSNEEFYAFQVSHKGYDKLLKMILRSYGGLFNDFTRISETDIAKRLDTDEATIISTLKKLEQLNVLIYDPQTTKPMMIFRQARFEAKNLQFDPENYQLLKINAQKRLEAMTGYINSGTKCRNKLLLEYFGEKNTKRCGKCDICLQRNKLEMSEYEFDSITNEIKPLLRKQPLTVDELIEKFDHLNDQKIIKVINWLIDNQKIIYSDDGKLIWRKKSNAK